MKWIDSMRATMEFIETLDTLQQIDLIETNYDKIIVLLLLSRLADR